MRAHAHLKYTCRAALIYDNKHTYILRINWIFFLIEKFELNFNMKCRHSKEKTENWRFLLKNNKVDNKMKTNNNKTKQNGKIETITQANNVLANNNGIAKSLNSIL